MQHFVGIDNSSRDHKVFIIDAQGNKKLSFPIPNSFDGFSTLASQLSNFTNCIIGFELPHGPLVDYLHSLHYPTYSLNPLKIKRFKESFKVSGNKNDIIDAHAIAEYLRTHASHSNALIYNSPVIEQLKVLAIIHSRLTRDKVRYINKLHYAVSQYFPLQESLFTTFGCPVHLKMLLRYPTYADLKAASPDEIRTFLYDNKYRIPSRIEKIICTISTYQQLISPEIEYAYAIEVQCLCALILQLDKTLHTIEQRMNFILDTHPLGKYFKTLPGAGPVLSCKLLSIFGDNKNRFAHYNNAQCLFGTAPKNYQSGIYHKVIMRKSCNKFARNVLFQFAFLSISFSQWARHYYDMQRAKGKTHSVALRALSNRWVKIIFKIWKDEILYDESKILSSVA